jgi:hypothetical protein
VRQCAREIGLVRSIDKVGRPIAGRLRSHPLEIFQNLGDRRANLKKSKVDSTDDASWQSQGRRDGGAVNAECSSERGDWNGRKSWGSHRVRSRRLHISAAGVFHHSHFCTPHIADVLAKVRSFSHTEYSEMENIRAAHACGV